MTKVPVLNYEVVIRALRKDGWSNSNRSAILKEVLPMC